MKYEDIGNAHKYFCTDCGYIKKNEGHWYEDKDMGDGTHITQCIYCLRIFGEPVAHTLVTTDTGDVSFENTYAPFTGMETDTGDIELNFFYAEEMDIKTSSGDVSGILQSQMTVIPETSTGSINIHHDVYGGKGTCRVTTSSGDISIRLSLEPR